MTGVSIIVCCYNSRTRLFPTLQHLHTLDVIGIPCEIVLVDNNSVDDTASFATKAWVGLGDKFPLYVVRELNLGLKFAREAGIAAAHLDYLIFCDDDNHLSPGYARRVFETFNSDTNIAMIGGVGTAFSSTPLPKWFDSFGTLYAVGKPVESPGPLPLGSGYVYGAGMAVRKQAWQRLTAYRFAGFSVDRKGGGLSGGHDVEISHAFRLINYTVVFDEALTFNHYIEPNRLTWPYVLALTRGSSSDFTSFVYYMILARGISSTFGFMNVYMRRLTYELLTILRLTFSSAKDQRKREVSLVVARTSFSFLLRNLHEALGYFRHVLAIRQKSRMEV